jgi:hypothetical protein
VIEIAKNLVHGRRAALTLSVMVASSFALGGCGGSSSGNPGDTPPDQSPTLTFSAEPSSVAPGGTATLTWNATGAQSCEASAGWSGSRAASGSQTVGPLDSPTEFRLSCSGAGGGVSGVAAVAVDDGSPSMVTLKAEPPQVPVDGTTTLSWSAPGAEECTATGDWSGTRPTSGSLTTSALARSSTFGLSCTGANGNAIGTVNVEVLDGMLRWDAPTRYADGSPISGVGGYVVYWGTQSGNYTNSHRIENAATTEWRADIPQAGTYYFALTAFDVAGIESDYSNEIVKSIQ